MNNKLHNYSQIELVCVLLNATLSWHRKRGPLKRGISGLFFKKSFINLNVRKYDIVCLKYFLSRNKNCCFSFTAESP